MFPLFLLGVALLIGLYLLAHSFVSADPRFMARVLRYGAIGVGTVVVLFLAITGQLGVALGIGAFLLPMLMRWRLFPPRARTTTNGAGRISSIETLYLRMTLDHGTGLMDGLVLRGTYQGRRLDEMPLDDLLTLMEECRRGDAQSAAVLETYLDRTRSDGWRKRGDDQPGAGAEGAGGGAESGGGAGRGAFDGKMTREEALKILGLEPGATPDAIKEAHRRLMLKLHPDQGGSTYLAAKINEAKDLLLRT